MARLTQLMPETPTWTPERVGGDVELALWRSGRVSPEAETILCIHGISSQHRSFNDLANYVRDGGSSVSLAAVDLRGRGDSDKPDTGYGLDVHVSDVIRCLDHLGVERSVLCGHSMGAFVAMKTAVLHPDRVKSLVLLDGGWPRPEQEPSKEERKAIQEGLARAFSRLDMTFDSPEAYLDFWFPGQGLRPEDLPLAISDYYLYDLEEVDGAYSPKTSRTAAEEDSDSISKESMTAVEMKQVSSPVALVRAAEGFFPGSEPLISEESRLAMRSNLDVRCEISLDAANHYTMMWEPNASKWAGLVCDDGWHASERP